MLVLSLQFYYDFCLYSFHFLQFDFSSNDPDIVDAYIRVRKAVESVMEDPTEQMAKAITLAFIKCFPADVKVCFSVVV